MGATTAIAWTHSTFNPWIGCTKVGPGCDNCYAWAGDVRWHQGKHWGAGAPRRRTSDKYWLTPFKWSEAAMWNHRRHLVFCASQADVFDNEVDPQWRADLFTLIRETPGLTWQLVTKRIGNAQKMLPHNWSAGLGFLPNVWIIATVVTQEECDRDIPKLLEIPAVVRGLSIEPQVEYIDITPWLWGREQARCDGCPQDSDCECGWNTRKEHGLHSIDWVICGGESTQFGKARPFEIAWAKDLREQCEGAHVPFFMKQLGARASFNGTDVRPLYKGKGDDPAVWVPDWKITAQEFPP